MGTDEHDRPPQPSPSSWFRREYHEVATQFKRHDLSVSAAEDMLQDIRPAHSRNKSAGPAESQVLGRAS